MAASSTQLFFDITNGAFVQSVADPVVLPNPILYAGDVRALLLQLVVRTSAVAVALVDLAGITVKIGIGTPGNVPVIIASATSGTVNGDGFLPIALDLSVAAVQTALGVAAEIPTVMELKIIGAADPHRLSLPCTLRQRLLT